MGTARSMVVSTFVLFALLVIPAATSADETDNATGNTTFPMDNSSSVMPLTATMNNVRITSGSAVSTIDPVTASGNIDGLWDGSYWNYYIGTIFVTKVEITYTAKLNYYYIAWWSDFSPAKQRVFKHTLQFYLGQPYADVILEETGETKRVYDWNTAKSYLYYFNDVPIATMSTGDSGLSLAAFSMAHMQITGDVGFFDPFGLGVQKDTNWASSGANPIVITVTNPPDPDIKFGGSRQYRLNSNWYPFSTPIKLKPGQSADLDFYVTNIGSGPSSSDGFVSLSINNNLDISNDGGTYQSAIYPPGSQLSGQCDVSYSQYKLLDTWTTYNAGASRYIYTKLTAGSSGEGWVKIRAGFDTPANGMNTVKDPRTGETSDTDEQCFPVYKIPVTVKDCFSDSDCPADSWVGGLYCQSSDVYQVWRDYYCSASGSCAYTDTSTSRQDCGDSYCDAWQSAYCVSGNQLWQNRNCYDKGCSSGACFSNSRSESQKIQDCLGKVDPWGSQYCSGNNIVHTRWVYAGACTATSPVSCTYAADHQETEVVQQCTDYCDAWSPSYCKGGISATYHNRTCHDRGCSAGDTACFDHVSVEEEKVSDCPSGCDAGQCVACSKDSDCGGWEGQADCCHEQSPGIHVCGNLNPLIDDVWQNKHVCINAGTKNAFCSIALLMKQDCISSGYGQNYCYDNDVYRDYVTGVCSSGACSQTTQSTEKFSECGNSSCDAWGSNYCNGSAVYHARNCSDRGCSAGVCFNSGHADEQKLEDCPAGCSNGQCNTVCTDECTHWQTRCIGNFVELCDNFDNDSCQEWGLRRNCNEYTYCAVDSCTGCQLGMLNCNANSSDGCEVNSTNNNNNCGDCGIVCATGKVCQNSICVNPPSCAATNISCGIWPSCLDCSLQNGCYGDYLRSYYCASNVLGCSYNQKSCSDCSCSCGGYNTTESVSNNNCNDGKDNDCNGKTDSADPGCTICFDACTPGSSRCVNSSYRQTCGSGTCSSWGNDTLCAYGCDNNTGSCWQPSCPINYLPCSLPRPTNCSATYQPSCGYGSANKTYSSSCFACMDTNSICFRSGLCVPGDADWNNRIDILDLAAVGLCYGKPATGGCAKADVNNDGNVNVIDLATVGVNYGRSV